MKGTHKFSPTSGVELSEDRYYPGTVPLREAVDGSGELSNGKLVSDTDVALTRHFRRMHARHHDEEDPALLQAAAAAIRRLREHDPWDCWLWYALAERLDRDGHDVDWMTVHVDPRCPRCSSRTKIEPSITGYPNVRCAAHCQHRNDVTIAVVERVLELYNAAFDDSISRVRVF